MLNDDAPSYDDCQRQEAERELLQWDGDLDNIPELLGDMYYHIQEISWALKKIQHGDASTIGVLALTCVHLAEQNMVLSERLTKIVMRAPISMTTPEDDTDDS